MDDTTPESKNDADQPALVKLATYQIRVVNRGQDGLEPPTLPEVEAKVKTAFAELTPGTVSTVLAERLDTD